MGAPLSGGLFYNLEENKMLAYWKKCRKNSFFADCEICKIRKQKIRCVEHVMEDKDGFIHDIQYICHDCVQNNAERQAEGLYV